MIQLKVENDQHKLETISPIVLHGLSSLVMLSGHLILSSKMTFRDWFYLEKVSNTAVNDIIKKN